MKILNSIIDKHYNLDKDEDGNEIFYKHQIERIAKEYAEQAIDECAGIAEADFNILDKESVISEIEVYVLKESILQVKNMLK